MDKALNLPEKQADAKQMALKLPGWFKTLLAGAIAKYGPDLMKKIIDELGKTETPTE